jgi:general secretion pathway protein G
MRAAGFTLVEVLITAAIVALLASVALPLAELGVQRDRERELKIALREIRAALDAYKRAGDEGRIERPADGSGYPPSLAVLVDGVRDKTDAEGARTHFLRRLPRDPVSGEDWGLRSYASPHDAPQAGRDVYDVYSVSPDSGMNGVPYKEW